MRRLEKLYPEVCRQQLHINDLLRYWIGSPVTVRISRHNLDFAYIYLNRETLCVASQAA